MYNSVNESLYSSFITVQLLSRDTFHEYINNLINQSISDAPVTLTTFLSILRAVNHGNAIISAYGTNFEYIDLWYNSSYTIAITQAMTYDNVCSCALNPTCTTQANFVDLNSSKILPLKGLKMGCTPSESFFASTLECFYDVSCIDLIEEQMNSTDLVNTIDAVMPLSLNMSQFPVNTTINDLVEKLFIENWSTTINYSAYYAQCLPLLCSYTYIQKLNSLYTITVLLGLCGGLTLILRWICPNIIYLFYQIHRYWRKRSNIVKSESSVQMATIETTNNTLQCEDAYIITVDSTSS